MPPRRPPWPQTSFRPGRATTALGSIPVCGEEGIFLKLGVGEFSSGEVGNFHSA